MHKLVKKSTFIINSGVEISDLLRNNKTSRGGVYIQNRKVCST